MAACHYVKIIYRWIGISTIILTENIDLEQKVNPTGKVVFDHIQYTIHLCL